MIQPDPRRFNLRGYAALCKARICGLVLFIGLATALMAGAGTESFTWRGLWFLAAALGLASMGASCLNHCLDRDVDANMPRTQGRPIPAGLIQPREALLVGFLLILGALPFALLLNGWVALYAMAGVGVYLGLYTWWLKRRSPWNIVVGGLAGSFAVLAGWTAVTPKIEALPLLLAALVFLWTPMHFWNFALVHLEEYRRAGTPMLPAVVGAERAGRAIFGTAFVVVVLSLLLVFTAELGAVYLLTAITLGILLGDNARLWFTASPQIAWRNFKLSGFWLAGVFGAGVADVWMV